MAVIYISSTYKDLKSQRKATAQAIEKLGHRAIAMENYVTSDERPVDKCLGDVKNCDVYVGIFAWRYGFIPDGRSKSITHLEYETAGKIGIPRLIFLLDKKAQWPVNKVSTGEDRKNIDNLRKELNENHIISYFKNLKELKDKLTTAILKLKLDYWDIPPEKWIGRRLGKYVIRKELGKGGKGIVFKVLDTLEDSIKAIKMIPSQVAYSPIYLKRLKREVNNARGITDHKVVKVLGLEKEEGKFFIVMEYIEGCSLEQELADSEEGRLKENKVINIMKELAQGLQVIHKNNVIHRDIKPSNIIVTPGEEVKILDFGISYQVTKSMTKLVGEDQQIGSLPYMAPEQLSNQYDKENQQVDVWGFGVTMYQLLSGKLPFRDREQIIDRNEKPFGLEGVSQNTQKIVMKCLEKNRKKRFQDMEEVLNAVEKRPQKWKWYISIVSGFIVVLLTIVLLLNLTKEESATNITQPPVVVTPETKGSDGKQEEQGKQKPKGESGENESLKPKKEKEATYKELLDTANKLFKEGDIKNAIETLEKVKKKTKKKIEADNLQIKIKKFQNYLSAAKDDFAKGNYDLARTNILEAKKLTINDELRGLENQIEEKIKEQKKIEKQKRDDLAYQKAKDENTITAYQEYLDKYPKGKYESEIKKKKRELEKMERMPEDVRIVANKGIKVYENEKGYWEADHYNNTKMVYVPKGWFNMGQTDEERKWLINQVGQGYYRRNFNDEQPIHKVYLDGFWMGKNEVTVSQYKLFVETQNHLNRARKGPGFKQGDNHPVVNVSWNDAVKYCEWMSEKTGFNFKLPSEAQWEKAARGHSDNNKAPKYPWGYHEPYDNNKWYANYCAHNKWKKSGKDGFRFTSPVGYYPKGASPYGLLDMAGNVWEWCDDIYASGYYKNSPEKNPTGPKKGNRRVMRGGCWYDYAPLIRCSSRAPGIPSKGGNNAGFRICQENK